MINKNIKIGIIGAGYMAEEYLKVLSKKKIWCEAIYSRTLSKCEKLRKKYKIKKISKSLNEFNANEEIKVIIITVNDISTFSLLKQLDLNRYKVLCEKPVGIDFKQTKKILSLLKKNKKNFFVSLNRRFYGSTMKAKNIVNKFKGKRLISIRDQQLQNTGSRILDKRVMYCNSVHLIDYIRIFARGRLKKISKLKRFKNNKFSETITKLYFSSKDEVLYHCNWNSPGSWSVNIVQQNSRCEMKPLEELMEEKLSNGKRKRVNHKKLLIDSIFKPGLFLQIDEFLKMLSNKKHNLITIKEYLETVKLVKRIYV